MAWYHLNRWLQDLRCGNPNCKKRILDDLILYDEKNQLIFHDDIACRPNHKGTRNLAYLERDVALNYLKDGKINNTSRGD